MKRVEHITELEEENLKAIKKHHLKYRERERAMGKLGSGDENKLFTQIFS